MKILRHFLLIFSEKWKWSCGYIIGDANQDLNWYQHIEIKICKKKLCPARLNKNFGLSEIKPGQPEKWKKKWPGLGCLSLDLPTRHCKFQADYWNGNGWNSRMEHLCKGIYSESYFSLELFATLEPCAFQSFVSCLNEFQNDQMGPNLSRCISVKSIFWH